MAGRIGNTEYRWVVVGGQDGREGRVSGLEGVDDVGKLQAALQWLQVALWRL